MSDELRDELLNDPLARGYSGMDDQAASDDLNTVYRERNLTSMSSSEVYNAIDQAEWAALTVVDRQELWDILHLGTVNPFGREAQRFTAIFGGGSTTISALADARKEDITRAEELEGVRSPMKSGYVEEARR